MAVNTGTRAVERKKRRQILTLAALTPIAAVTFGGRVLSGGPAVSHAAGPADEAAVAGRPPSTSYTIEVMHHDAAWGTDLARDVFATPPEPGDEVDLYDARIEAVRRDAEAFRPSVIMYSDDPQTLINGRVYRVGDFIGPLQIKGINERSVVFAKSDIEVEMDLK